MTREPNDFVAEAKEQVATHTCEGSHHNHDLIVGLLTEVERLTARCTQASTAFMYATNRAEHYEAEVRRLRAAIRTTASEGSYNEMAIRKAVSFELAELIVEARAALESTP